MALGQIAPWLQLPNFQQAAEAGARIGLQQKQAAEEIALDRAKLEQSSIESSGRLGLGFTEATNAARRAQAEQELAKATMALHQGRYSDLNQQADARHQLGEDRLTALEDNRDTVNGLHRDQLDALTDHRDAVEALSAGRLAGGGSKAAPKEKAFMVKIPVPANPETGEAATTISLPSTHPSAVAYLKVHGMSGVPSETDTGIYQPSDGNQTGETLPLPDGTAQAAQALQPRNLIYEGAKTDNPIFDPGTMPAEELAAPTAPPAADKVLSKDLAAGFLKQAKGDKDTARKLARVAGYTF